MAKLPAIQWYPNDWQNDIGVQSLGFEERGIWWEVLQRMHQTEARGKMVMNGRAMTDEEIAHVIHCDVAKFQQALNQIFSKGVASRDEAGALMNRRMVTDENLRNTRAACGALGGLQKASNSVAKHVAKSTPSSSSSVTSSVSTSTPTKTKDIASLFIPEDLKPNEPEILIWLAYKRERGQTYRPKGMTALFARLREIPPHLRKASIEQSMANNWSGLFQVKGDFDGKNKSTGAPSPAAGKYSTVG